MPNPVRGSMNELLACQMGQWGTHTISDTNANTRAGGWTVIDCIEDTVFDTLTDLLQETGSDDPTGITSYAAGTKLYGLFTAVTLTSGSVRCYSSPQET